MEFGDAAEKRPKINKNNIANKILLITSISTYLIKMSIMNEKLLSYHLGDEVQKNVPFFLF